MQLSCGKQARMKKYWEGATKLSFQSYWILFTNQGPPKYSAAQNKIPHGLGKKFSFFKDVPAEGKATPRLPVCELESESIRQREGLWLVGSVYELLSTHALSVVEHA
jgi:hypothetical protein